MNKPSFRGVTPGKQIMPKFMGTGDITLFALPRAYEGAAAVTQENAIRSWRRLGYTVHLLGDERGTFETALESATQYTPELPRAKGIGAGKQGVTPGGVLLNDVFAIARERAKTPYICYLNPNIILTQPIRLEVTSLGHDFLCVGRKWDIAVDELIDFQDADALAAFRHHIISEGSLHMPSGVAYVIMPRDSVLAELPKMTADQGDWGNVIIEMAWRRGLPIVELTACFHSIQQLEGCDCCGVKDCGCGVAVGSGGVGEAGAGIGGEGGGGCRHGARGMYPQLRDISHATYRADAKGGVHPRHNQLACMHYDLAKNAEAEVKARVKHAIDFIPHFTFSHLYDDPPLELPTHQSVTDTTPRDDEG